MTTTKKLVTNLNPGDVVVTREGNLVVLSVDASAAFTIVDFVDGTATPPLRSGSWVEVQTDPPSGIRWTVNRYGDWLAMRGDEVVATVVHDSINVDGIELGYHIQIRASIGPFKNGMWARTVSIREALDWVEGLVLVNVRPNEWVEAYDPK